MEYGGKEMNGYERKGSMKSKRSGIVRGLVASVVLIFQFLIVIYLSFFLNNNSIYIYYGMQIIGLIIIIGLVNNSSNDSFKIGWLILIAAVPVAGLIMYALWGRSSPTKKLRTEHMKYIEYGYRFERYDEAAEADFAGRYPSWKRLSAYMKNEHFPMTSGNSLTYYRSGEEAFEAVFEDVRKARRFVFLDFFIVADGALWKRMSDLLIQKASEGVEIRFLYDDFGAMTRTDRQLWKLLKNNGIRVAIFNPIQKEFFKLYFNYRSHQKIIIVDGDIAYTGGFNLADEYVNLVHKLGYWKDSGIRVEGNGAYGLTSIFLGMWGMAAGERNENYDFYKPSAAEPNRSFVQVIADGPENNPKNPIASGIMQMIYGAQKRLYITTPYLVIEQGMLTALKDAAKSGVDVRIITPSVPDKKAVFMLTRYNYVGLLEAGVRIYEYTPGFIHAKTVVADDLTLLGTINMDYRSLYLHYECGTIIWDEDINREVAADIESVIAASHEVTYEECKSRPLLYRGCQKVLNLFSSLV